MGEVYRAQDLTLERSVALKILPPRLVKNEERLRRFVIGAKSAPSSNRKRHGGDSRPLGIEAA